MNSRRSKDRARASTDRSPSQVRTSMSRSQSQSRTPSRGNAVEPDSPYEEIKASRITMEEYTQANEELHKTNEELQRNLHRHG